MQGKGEPRTHPVKRLPIQVIPSTVNARLEQKPYPNQSAAWWLQNVANGPLLSLLSLCLALPFPCQDGKTDRPTRPTSRLP